MSARKAPAAMLFVPNSGAWSDANTPASESPCFGFRNEPWREVTGDAASKQPTRYLFLTLCCEESQRGTVQKHATLLFSRLLIALSPCINTFQNRSVWYFFLRFKSGVGLFPTSLRAPKSGTWI